MKSMVKFKSSSKKDGIYGVVVSHAMIQWLVATASAIVLMATAPKNSDILVIVCVEHRMVVATGVQPCPASVQQLMIKSSPFTASGP